jgi:hypothetical protein
MLGSFLLSILSAPKNPLCDLLHRASRLCPPLSTVFVHLSIPAFTFIHKSPDPPTSFLHCRKDCNLQNRDSKATMASNELAPAELEKASKLAHVPHCAEYDKMISGML